MKVGVIGLGLIGGSLARDLATLGHHIVGFDKSPQHIEQAIELGIIEEALSYDELVATAELIVVSIPVSAAPACIHDILDKIKANQVVIDTGSTKNNLCEAVRAHPRRGRFVACHPLAGTEFSGPQAAIHNLFDGKKNIICEEGSSDDDALSLVIEMWQSIGTTNIFMHPAEHDKHVAYVSHLSHISAFTLGSTVLDIEKDEKQISNLAGTGFQSTVRLAKSSPDTWSTIFLDNKTHILPALDSYLSHLQEMREALVENDKAKLQELIQNANEIKRVLNGIKYNIVKLS